MLVGVNTIVPHDVARKGDFRLPNYTLRYLDRMLRRVSALQDATDFVLFQESGVLASIPGVPAVEVEVPSASRWRPNRAGAALKQAIQRQNPDILLSPLQAASLELPGKIIYYTLDLLPWEEEAAGFPQKIAKQKALKRAVAQALAVIVPSDHVRKDCLEAFGASLDKTIVAPPGIPEIFQQEHASMVDGDYLLVFDDGCASQKVRQLAESLGEKHDEIPIALVVAGPGDGSEEAWGEHVVRIEQCPDAHLAGLYQHAQLFIYPASSDHSAMRVLEALGAGCCVITPHGPAVKELASNAPFYYDPGGGNSFLQSLRRALAQSSEERRQRVQHGKSIAARFSWDDAVWKMLTALKR
jgi:glycosyltransferase involved in cell wall biosynthesis